MKAITICQPYAHLIATGEKSVENRSWDTRYRGWLAIHAGKGRAWLSDGDELRYPGMVFGAIVAVAWLATVIEHHRIADLVRERDGYAWLPDHPHAEGPYCWVLPLVYRLRTPVPYKGRQGLYTLDAATVAELRREGMTPPIRAAERAVKDSSVPGT